MNSLNIIQCPQCQSKNYRKNGTINGKQRYQCKSCGRNFLTVSFGQSLSFLSQKISILLLDAENLRLDSKIENFLAKNCQYPLQIKIAFANWKTPNLSKQDFELNERGYQLIHVPEGKDSADGKMIAVGSSIFLQYPTVQEIFICSNDTIFINLCTELENKGFTIYRLRKEASNLVLENRKTGKFSYYSRELNTEIPNQQEIYNKLQELIKLEDKNIKERLLQLDQLAVLFQERTKLSGQTLIVSDYSDSLQSKNKSIVAYKSNLPPTESNEKKQFLSKSILEMEIMSIIQTLIKKLNQKSVPISNVASQFQVQHKLSVTEVMKSLNLGNKFCKLLQECPNLELTKKGTVYYVKVVNVSENS